MGLEFGLPHSMAAAFHAMIQEEITKDYQSSEGLKSEVPECLFPSILLVRTLTSPDEIPGEGHRVLRWVGVCITGQKILMAVIFETSYHSL